MLLNCGVAEDSWEFLWTARRSNQLLLKEINPEYLLERLMLKLKLQYFGHLLRKADSFVKTLMLGKIKGGRRRGWQRMRWLYGSPTRWTWVWVGFGSWWRTGKPGMLQSTGSQRVSPNWATELNWTEGALGFCLSDSVLCLPSSGWKEILMKPIDCLEGTGTKGSWMAPKENWEQLDF